MSDGVTIRGWRKGMNNIAPEFAMPHGTLRDATNVDVLDDGRIRSRKGFKSAASFAGATMHSLFSYKGLTLVMDGGSLKSLDAAFSPVTLRAGMDPFARLCYAVVNEEVCYSNRTVTGKVSLAAAHSPLGVERPSGQPTVSAAQNGALAPGRYQVAVVFVSATGEESGTGKCAVVDIQDGGAIALTHIPQPTTPQVTTINIYVTEADGSIPYHTATVAVGTSSYTVRAQALKGRALQSQFCTTFPPCETLVQFAGRLWGVIGSVLVASDALAYGRFRPGVNAIYFPAQISILKAVDDGLWLVSDQHYFLAGRELGKQVVSARLPYGAVAGTAVEIPFSNKVGWFSDRGFVIAGPGGAISNISESNVAVGAAAAGASMVREQEGLSQIVSAVKNTGPTSGLVISDYAEAEVIRGKVAP